MLTSRTRLHRHPERGAHDFAAVASILDQGILAHVGFVSDGSPFVIPTLYARVDRVMYIHGSSASRMQRALGTGVEVCVTVTLMDGIVLARSAYNHSINYRSVVVLGTSRLVTGADEKDSALRAIVERVAGGRWAECRPPSPVELKATAVVAVPLEEASAKVRTGPPVDFEEDLALDWWAGVLPVLSVHGQPVPDAHVRTGARIPEYTYPWLSGSPGRQDR